jgi:hypothetical protein
LRSALVGKLARMSKAVEESALRFSPGPRGGRSAHQGRGAVLCRPRRARSDAPYRDWRYAEAGTVKTDFLKRSKYEDAHFSCCLVHLAGLVLAFSFARTRCFSLRLAAFSAAPPDRDHRGGSLRVFEGAPFPTRPDSGLPKVLRLSHTFDMGREALANSGHTAHELSAAHRPVAKFFIERGAIMLHAR